MQMHHNILQSPGKNHAVHVLCRGFDSCWLRPQGVAVESACTSALNSMAGLMVSWVTKFSPPVMMSSHDARSSERGCAVEISPAYLWSFRHVTGGLGNNHEQLCFAVLRALFIPVSTCNSTGERQTMTSCGMQRFQVKLNAPGYLHQHEFFFICQGAPAS
jgi:hypothetical protein